MNESIVNEEADPEVPNEDAAPRPSMLTRSVTPVISIPKPGNMIITVSKRKFECVSIESASDTTEKSKKENSTKYSEYLRQSRGKRWDLHAPKDYQNLSTAYWMIVTSKC